MKAVMSRFLSSCRATARDAIRIWWLMPILPLIAFGGELWQHALEIKLGLFASQEAFDAFTPDKAYAKAAALKITALLITMLFSSRYLASRSPDWPPEWTWWGMGGILWKRQFISLIIGIGMIAPVVGIYQLWGREAALLGLVILAIITLPNIVYAYGSMVGDAQMTLRRAFTAMWPSAIVMMLATILLFTPLQILHVANHYWAIGKAPNFIWAIMIWDSILVGLIGTMLGAVMHNFYWRDDA